MANIIPLLVLLVLAAWSSLQVVTSTVSDRICFGPYDEGGTKCNPMYWGIHAIQERVFKTFKYDVFENGSGSLCIPFDIKTGKNDDQTTITVFSYFSCDYGDSVDERACVRCRNEGIRALREGCSDRAGAVVRSEHCCLRYETYNMCIDP